MKRLVILFFLLTVFASFFPHLYAEGDRTFVIFQTTDLHGTIGDDKKPGIMQIAAEIQKERKVIGENSLWIDCGDLTQGSLTATFDQGATMISALNAAGCDFFVPGNHDFEYGRETLIRNLKAFRGTVLAANLQVAGFDGLKPWALAEKNGIRVAVLGIVPPYLKLWIEPDMLEGISLTSAEAAIGKYMPAIMASKPHVIVLAIHLGEYTSKRLTGNGKIFNLGSIASKYPQIDLILCGHTHQTEPGKRLYAGSWLVQAPPIGADAARIDIKLNIRKSVLLVDEITSKLLGVSEASPRSPELQSIFASIQKQENRFAATKIAKLDFDLKPMVSSKTECRLAKEICSAMCEATGADAAFSSSISNYSKQEGILNERGLFNLIPYNNAVVSRKLTPAQIRTIVRELEDEHADLGTWMTWTGFTLPYGSTGQVVSDKTGKAVPEDGQLSVAFNSYTASGAGGRYPELAEILKDAPVFRAKLPDLRDVFRNYLKKHYPYI